MSNQRIASLLTALAGLMGTAGVILSALAAHRVEDPALATAATFLLLHAVATLALSAHASISDHPRMFEAAGLLMAIGASAFAGAIALRVLGAIVAPGMAPIGGATTIVSWVIVSVAAISISIRGLK